MIAKDIIHLLLTLQDLIKDDSEVAPYMKLVMVENYNVSAAEKLFPACDISEQISLASKEASGTGLSLIHISLSEMNMCFFNRLLI